MYKNAVLLGVCQLLFMTSSAVGISFNGLVGIQLSASSALATLPYLFITATTAALTLVLPDLFNRVGYRYGFVLGAVLGILGGWLAVVGIWMQSFVVFCAAGLLIGSYQATALYYRFAAADSVDQAHKGIAIAWVLNGGIIAALLAPALASHSLNWFRLDYLGSYIAVAVLITLALPIFMVMRLPERQFSPASNIISVAEVLAYPKAVAAIIFCAGGYALMMLIMIASPLAMQNGGFTAHHAASVIQWHLLGMFGPSLLTGKLIARYGSMTLGFLGCGLMVIGCVIGLLGEKLEHFHWALMLVGVAWNFMYMGGSTFITQIPELALRSRLQSLNEFVTFGVMTLTAGVTGWLYHTLGWQTLLWVAAIFAVLVILLIFTDTMREVILSKRQS